MTAAATTVLVEGESDRRALEVLAPRLGVDLPAVVVLHGITNLRARLARLDRPDRLDRLDRPERPDRGGDQVHLLHDRAESSYVGRVLSGHTAHPGRQVRTHVCDADLEDELVRAVGVEAMLAVVDAQGERAAYERMAQQPAQRDRTDAQRLRRWLGARSGHKLTYAGLLAEAVALDAVPAPLASLLEAIEQETGH